MFYEDQRHLHCCNGGDSCCCEKASLSDLPLVDEQMDSRQRGTAYLHILHWAKRYQTGNRVMYMVLR